MKGGLPEPARPTIAIRAAPLSLCLVGYFAALVTHATTAIASAAALFVCVKYGMSLFKKDAS